MTSRIDRLLIALMFALLAAGVTLIVASAQEGAVPPVQTSSDCATCHTEFQVTWQNGAHGKSGSDPIFLYEWAKQGKPGACLVCHTTGYDPATATYKSESVTCESCHSPVPTDHPKSPMPVERSAELCARCHSDTRSEAQASKVSTHDQKGLDCAACHDPHSASLKTPPGPRTAEKTDEVSQLCITCHQESNMDFSLTAHGQRNVSCTDCHVSTSQKAEDSNRAPHTPPDHSFKASLASCNTCHVQQMHSPTEAVNTKESTVPVPVEPVAKIKLTSTTPEAVSPLGFSAMAGLIGLASGTVLAPWLERWYRRTVKQNREDNDE
jgi:predicted CXXCH cytochrome family protein